MVDTIADTLFEIRLQKNATNQAAILARSPAWAPSVPRSDRNGSLLIVVGGRKDACPIVLDSDSRTANKVAWHTWSRGYSILQYDGWFYVGGGEYGGTSQNASLYRIRELNNRPELLVDLGSRLCTGGWGGDDQYYCSMVVVQNQLHLLTNRADFEGLEPAWVAVDLNTFDARLLIDRMPDEFRKRREYRDQKLVVSPQYGLLFLSGGNVFQVELPPVAEGPLLPVKKRRATSPPTSAAADR